MTFGNLNGNWIDTLSREYTRDLTDQSTHPIKYLLWNNYKGRDIFCLIANKIDPSQLRRSLVDYHLATKGTAILEWENLYIKTWPHPHDPSAAQERNPTAEATEEVSSNSALRQRQAELQRQAILQEAERKRDEQKTLSSNLDSYEPK